MPALNFQKRFAPAVEDGTKRQTIRAYRKDGRDPQVGQPLYLYTGMRTKACRKLGEAKCESVSHFIIARGFRQWVAMKTVCNCLRRFQGDSANRLARDDGFENFAEMCNWFEKTHGLPFRGLMIRWGQLEML